MKARRKYGVIGGPANLPDKEMSRMFPSCGGGKSVGELKS